MLRPPTTLKGGGGGSTRPPQQVSLKGGSMISNDGTCICVRKKIRTRSAVLHTLFLSHHTKSNRYHLSPGRVPSRLPAPPRYPATRTLVILPAHKYSARNHNTKCPRRMTRPSSHLQQSLAFRCFISGDGWKQTRHPLGPGACSARVAPPGGGACGRRPKSRRPSSTCCCCPCTAKNKNKKNTKKKTYVSILYI